MSHFPKSAFDRLATPAAPQAVGEPVAPGEKTIFGLDYDGTITRDPDMWHAVMRLMQAHGHEVHIVTMRHGVESTMGGAPMEQRFLDGADGVHFTGNSQTGDRDAKRPHMDAKGIGVHVWIDDNPKAVHMSAREIWGWCTQPGDPMLHSAPEIAAPVAPRVACQHRIAYARNQHVQSGYVCLDCGAVFQAADHAVAPRAGEEPLTDELLSVCADAGAGGWVKTTRIREAIATLKAAPGADVDPFLQTR